jgi:hypothetical protein
METYTSQYNPAPVAQTDRIKTVDIIPRRCLTWNFINEYPWFWIQLGWKV